MKTKQNLKQILNINNVQENWKDLPGYEGYYQVSDQGRVRSVDREVVDKNGRILSLSGGILQCPVAKNGYISTVLYRDGKFKGYKIHQLVAITFLNHTPDGNNLVVDHKNTNKLDNRLSNLQIITQRENCTKDKNKTKTTSKYIGVDLYSGNNKWRAQIRINGKKKYLGCFLTEIEAHESYQEELKKINSVS